MVHYVSINFDKFTLQELLDLQQFMIQEIFEDILTEKMLEGKIVFSEVENGLMN